MRNLRNNKKGLSVIFGVLILIAIAVIAGIIIYLYTSGYLATMMGGGGAGQEKVTILGITNTATTFTVSAKSVGGGPVTISEAIVKDAAGNTVSGGVVDCADVVLAGDGTLGSVPVTFGLASGNYYTVTLVSKLGNTFVSTSFKAT